MPKVNVPIRPLTKGIMRNTPSNLIPKGGFYSVDNLYTNRNGLKKRGGLNVYQSLTAVAYPPLRGMDTYWNTAGNKITVVFDQKFMYYVTTSGYVRKEWTYTTGTLSTSGTTATGSGTAWQTAANYIQAGDLMVLDADGSGDGPEEILITAIASDTSLTLASTPAGTYGAGTDYKIVRAFKSIGQNMIDYSSKNGALYITDNNHPILKWDGSNFTTVYSGNLDAGCVLYFKNRLFAGNILDNTGGTYHKQRIVWGDVLSETLDNYIDLPYTSDVLLRLVPLGELIVAYFENSIWIGRPTNQGTSLPYEFNPISRKGVGLAGPRSIYMWTDGHFFIGNDNLYYMGAANALEEIGDSVIDMVKDNTSYLWSSYVAMDIENDMACFGIPGTGTNLGLENIYMFNYSSKAWCRQVINVDFLETNNLQDTVTIDSLTGTIDAQVGVIDELGGGAQGIKLWHGRNGALTNFTEGSVTDNGDTLNIVIETGDFDLDKPDKNKGFYECSLKLREPYTSTVSGENFTLNLEGSVDKGVNWKSLGTFTITVNNTEDKINFRMLGSHIRFKFSNQNVNFDSFVIEEMVFTVRLKGEEVPGQQTG